MEKSSFELRTELLKQAQDITGINYWKELSKADSQYNYHMSMGDIPRAQLVVFPVAPTVDDIIKVATELNIFISKSIKN